MTDTAIPRRYALLARSGGWSLVQALRNSGQHQLVDWQLADAAVADAWKLLVERSDIDAVLVDGDDPQTLQSARELAARGMPLVVRVRATLPPEYVAELSLYAAEAPDSVLPWFDHRHGLNGHQQWDSLKEWVASAPVGRIRGIQIDRDLCADAEFRSNVFLTSLLLTDIDIMRMIGGDYSQVTLIRTGNSNDSFTGQTLQLAGHDRPDATCQYRRAAVPGGLRLRIDGTQSSAEVRAEDDDLVWSVGGVEVERSQPPEFDAAARSAEQQRLLDHLDLLWTQPQETPRWNDLTRLFEIAEAMQRSLRRRRTIDLQFETTSERSQFKTHMATIGCGVILWTMFGIMGLLFAGAVLDPRDGMQRQAEAAGFVLRAGEFKSDAATLTPAGRSHLQQISTGIGRSDAVVYIEATTDDGDPTPLDEQRRAEVWSQLSAAGADDPSRVVARPLRGEWFSRILRFARVLVFAPVALFLLFQLLLLITRPAAPQSQKS
jgi:hypothetical protein